MKEYPSFTLDDIGLLFSDIATLVGLIINHNDPRECFVIFLILGMFLTYSN